MKLNHLLPGTCIICRREPVYEDLPVCPRCISYVQEAITAPCRNCGFEARRCRCYGRARFAIFYGNSFGAVATVAFLKGHGDRNGSDFIVELLFSLVLLDPTACDAVVAAPRTRRNYKRIGCDQSKELAKAVAQLYGVEFLDVLKSSRFREQKHLDRRSRIRNMRKSVLLRRRLVPKGPLHRVLLVDDIRTTGATIDGCSDVLRGRVSRQVTALTLAHSNTPRQVL